MSRILIVLFFISFSVGILPSDSLAIGMINDNFDPTIWRMPIDLDSTSKDSGPNIIDGVICLEGRPDSEFFETEYKLENCNQLKSFGFESFEDEKICGCMHKTFITTRGAIPDPYALAPLEPTEEKEPPRKQFDENDAAYFEEVGQRLMNQMNSTVERIGIISMMAKDQNDLAQIASCRVSSIIDSMKNAINNCEDKESAQQVFNMMFIPNIEQRFKRGHDGAKETKFADVIDALNGEMKQNLKVWSSESTPKRFENACVPLKDFALMQMLRTDPSNTPYKDEYENLLTEYRINKDSGSTNSKDPSFNSDLSSPILEVLVNNEALMDRMLDQSPPSDEYYELNRISRFHSLTHIPNQNLRSNMNILDLIKKDPSLKSELFQKLAKKANETCQTLSNIDDYKELLCLTPSYRPSTKLLVETTPAKTWQINSEDAQNLNSTKMIDYNRKYDLFGRSCSKLPKSRNEITKINNQYEDNKLLNLIAKSSQPVSYMDNFKASEPHSEIMDVFTGNGKDSMTNARRGLMMQLTGLDIDHNSSLTEENSLGRDYEDFNKLACNGSSQIDASLNAISNMSKGLSPEVLAIIEKIEKPSKDGTISTGEMALYFAKVKSAIIEAYKEEFYELYDNEKVEIEVKALVSEEKKIAIGLTRWLKEVKGIDFEEMEKNLDPQSVEDLGILAEIQSDRSTVAEDEKVPVIDYVFNATAEEQVLLEASVEEASTDVVSPYNTYDDSYSDSVTNSPTGASVNEPRISSTQRRPSSFTYIPKGLPVASVGESFLDVKEQSPVVAVNTNDELPVINTEPKSEPIVEPTDNTVVLSEDDPVEDRSAEKDRPTEVAQNLDVNGPGFSLSATSNSPVINASGTTIAANTNSDSLDSSELNKGRNDSSNDSVVADNSSTGKNDKLMDELRAMRDKLKGSNSDLASRINNLRSAGGSGGASRNSGRSPSSVTSAPKNYSFNGPSRPSRNAFNQFAGQTVSSADDSKNKALAERVKAAKKEGNFTDKPSAFPGGGGGSGRGGSSRSPASVSGGPNGSGVIAGAGGNIFVPPSGDGSAEGGDEYIDPLSDLIEGLFEDDRPHVLSKVIPHALILNDENGAQGLIETLGLQGRRFTTLDVYYLTPGGKPSYNVSIYDYDIGDNDTLNNVKFRKRLIKTIDILKKDNAETEQYMKQFYGDSKYSQPEEILGSISAKLKLMYKRPGCANPDYDPVGGGPCIHSDEIEKLKNRLLTQEELIELIEYDSSLKMSE